MTVKTEIQFPIRFCHIPNIQSWNLPTHALIKRRWKVQVMDEVHKAHSKSNGEDLPLLCHIWLNLN